MLHILVSLSLRQKKKKKPHPRVLMKTKDNMRDETYSEEVFDLVMRISSTLHQLFLKLESTKF